MMASPRTLCAPNDSAMPLSGWPSKRSRKMSDQATVKPQLAGRSGDIVTPLAASVSTHAPSDPSRGQLAPPSASTVALRIDDARSVRRFKQQAALLVPAGPAVAQRELHAHRIEPPQPCAQQRRGLERFGKHPAAGADEGRLPQRLAPCAQRVRRKRLDRGARAAASPRRSARGTAGSASLCVRLSPPRPAIRNLRPADGIAS